MDGVFVQLKLTHDFLLISSNNFFSPACLDITSGVLKKNTKYYIPTSYFFESGKSHTFLTEHLFDFIVKKLHYLIMKLAWLAENFQRRFILKNAAVVQN